MITIIIVDNDNNETEIINFKVKWFNSLRNNENLLRNNIKKTKKMKKMITMKRRRKMKRKTITFGELEESL